MAFKDVLILVPVSIHNFCKIILLNLNTLEIAYTYLKWMWNKYSFHLLIKKHSVITDSEAWAAL